MVHLDNDHPYVNARAGERLLIFTGMLSQHPVGEGEVIGRMNADDPRANAKLLSRDTPGIFFRNERGDPEWKPVQRLSFWRREDGILKLTR